MGARSACKPGNETAHKHDISDKANKHVPVIAMENMQETTDDTNNPIPAIRDDSAPVKYEVAIIIRGLEYSKVVIKSNQEPAIRSMERNVVECLFEDDFKELSGCHVVMQHSPVGVSSANGAIDSAFQRVQGQVRAIKLDLETNIKTRLIPSQTTWPWLIEYAAQTLLFGRISGDDGLIAVQRVR